MMATMLLASLVMLLVMGLTTAAWSTQEDSTIRPSRSVYLFNRRINERIDQALAVTADQLNRLEIPEFPVDFSLRSFLYPFTEAFRNVTYSHQCTKGPVVGREDRRQGSHEGPDQACQGCC